MHIEYSSVIIFHFFQDERSQYMTTNMWFTQVSRVFSQMVGKSYDVSLNIVLNKL